MRALAHTSAGVLAAAFLWSGLAAALASEPPRDTQSSNERAPASSRCMAACEAMEVRCEELEREFSTCGTADVCLEEKERCEAKCGAAPTARLPAVPGPGNNRG